MISEYVLLLVNKGQIWKSMRVSLMLHTRLTPRGFMPEEKSSCSNSKHQTDGTSLWGPLTRYLDNTPSSFLPSFLCSLCGVL